MNENRRNFLKKAGVGTAGILTFPTILPSAILGKSSPSNRINVAMIGCGRQTKDPNIPQLLASENCQVVAVCDVDSRRMTNARDQVNDFYSAEKKRKYNGCVMYNDYRQLLLDKSIDAVMISSPDHWHVPMSIDAARHGKHISLEKPISTCIEHGRRLVEAIKKYKVITRNDSEFRTLPMFTRAVELVRNRRIGDLERIYVVVPPELSGAALPPQPTMPVPAELNYDMWLGPAFEAPYTENRVHPRNDYGRPGWMRVKDYCNGMISNWGAHLIGIAQWGNNSEYTGPVFITGTGDFDKGLWNTLNRFDIHYQFENGVEMYFRIERPYVRFEGTLGWVEIE
ncbi:MAG: Gfo/Idh/MocA family oxidoreductase, partial [Bacteroidales bacterium]|nr:Gfo/Idh/MocA family oxidoreductase [Bacteroidales bacterium]